MALIDELNLTINVDQERLKKIETDMKKLASATNEVKDNINGLKSAISNLGAALEKASPQRHARAQKQLAKQTKDTAAAINKEAKEAKQLGKASEDTAKSKEKVVKASKTQADAEEKVAKKTKQAKDEVEGLRGSMKKLGDTEVFLGLRLKDLDKKASTFFTTITNLQKKLDSFRVASTFGTIGAIVAGVSGVVLAGGWRQGAINTGVKQGAYEYGGYPGRLTEEYVDAARQLGERFRAVDPTQIEKAFRAMMHPRLGRLGYGVNDVKKLTGLILSIAGATGSDAGYLAPVVSQILGEYGIGPASAERSILQMFDVARKTGAPMLNVAHYMADMAPVARRTGTGYGEMLTRGGQAWYAGADPSLVYGAIYQMAQNLTEEYKGRYQESIETLRTTDMWTKEFKQAWHNLFLQDFPGPSDEVYDFLIALRKKQLFPHEMEGLVLSFAAAQGYGLADLYAGNQTYRKQIDTLMTDLFIKENPSIGAMLPDDVRDAVNLIKDKLPESTEALSHIDVNTDEIAAMRTDVKSGWDRMIEAIKSFFTPLINWVGGIFRHLIPKASRADLERERLGEEAGLPYGEEQKKTLTVSDGLVQEKSGWPWLNSVIGKYTTEEELKKLLTEKYPYGTFQLVKGITALQASQSRYSGVPAEPMLREIKVDPVGKLLAKGVENTLAMAQYGHSSTPAETGPQLGNGTSGTRQLTFNITFQGTPPSQYEMEKTLTEVLTRAANGTGV